MTIMILNYGRNLPRTDKGILPLHMGKSNAQNAEADLNWQMATYISQHPFQNPDVVMNLSDRFTKFDAIVDKIFCMPPSDPALIMDSSFWKNIVAWMKAGAIFITIPEDDHIIDPYLVKINRYDIFFQLKKTPYHFMSTEFQATINYCYYLFRSDIVKLSFNQLIATDASEFVVDDSLVRKALVFTKLSDVGNME